MDQQQPQLTGPDLGQGVRADLLADGAMLVGHASGEAVVLARHGDEFFAVGATCTHYGAPLGDGLVVGDTVRCPWHHACFSLRTGEALRAPALNPIAVYAVDRAGDRLAVGTRVTAAPPAAPPVPVGTVPIIGAGAAGEAAAELLRSP